MESTISFKSKIHFVNDTAFDALKKGTLIDFKAPSKSIQIADEFFTENIRTCSGGALINTKTKQAAGFHFYDGIKERFFEHKKYLDEIFSKINPDKCFLIGGNNFKDSPFSIEQFEKLKNIFSQRTDKMTVIEEHSFPYAETNLHYSAKDDVFNIYSMYRPNSDYKEHAILSQGELLQCFKNVIISPDDELVFN